MCSNPVRSYHGSPSSTVHRETVVQVGVNLGKWAKLVEVGQEVVGVRRGLKWAVLTWTHGSVIAGSLFAQRPAALRAV